MKFSRELIIFFLYSLQFSLCKSDDESCKPMSCLSSQTSIEFPFRIKYYQPESCGSPGFDVYCAQKLGRPLLELHPAGNFSIDYIYYDRQEIYLSDPDNCFPRKLMSLNLTKISPFRPLGQYKNFQLYNCSRNYQSYHNYDQIDCLSGSGYGVVSVGVDSSISDPNCTLLKFVSAPGIFSFSKLSSVSSISLTWDEPYCKSCGSIPPLLVSGDEDPGQGTPGAGIGLGVGITALLVLIVCYSWRRSRTNHQPAESPTSTNDVSQQRHSTAPAFTSGLDQRIIDHSTIPAFASGLDQRIIDSYPMVVIGESGRLIKPGDDMCPICLCEYAPRETLKMLPECLHRFHADCIDEWLRTKAICPICRISPSRF